MRTITLATLLFVSTIVMASPLITSVTPNIGPMLGGTTVQIHGSGFSQNCVICSPPVPVPPEVRFGGVVAPSVRFVSDTLLEAVTPPHPKGTVSVSVSQLDGSDPNHYTLPSAFHFDDIVYADFDPILFPVFMPPIRGQGGSEFVTSATIVNRTEAPVTLFGYDATCTPADPPIAPERGITLASRFEFPTQLLPECNARSVGWFLFVPKGNKSIAANLRVSETSKQALNHGVEIPVATIDDFVNDTIALPNVPVDSRYRLTLRIYSLSRREEPVIVTYSGVSEQFVLQPGESIFEPAYAEVSQFHRIILAPPLPGETMTVFVERPRNSDGSIQQWTPFWAFITVTNNETQHITTITPQQ
jgi:hypothetical protein